MGVSGTRRRRHGAGRVKATEQRSNNPITLDSVGRRHYLCGDTYAIKDKIKAAGFKWDPDRKCWWTGQREKAEEFLPKAEKAAEKASGEKADFRTEMDRRRAEGLSLAGTACKADEAKRHGGVWDRRREVWLFPSREGMQGCLEDAAKRRGSKAKVGGGGRWDEVPLIGTETELIVETVEPGGGRGYKPELRSLIGQTRMIRSRGESLPMTTIGAKAYYLRSDDAEDQGDYGGSGWRVIEYMRPAAEADAEPLIRERASKQRRQEMVKELDRLVRTVGNLTEEGWPQGKIVGGHNTLAGSQGFIVEPSSVSYVESSYDDAPHHWKTTEPRAVKLAHELFGVTTTQKNPARTKGKRSNPTTAAVKARLMR